MSFLKEERGGLLRNQQNRCNLVLEKGLKKLDCL